MRKNGLFDIHINLLGYPLLWFPRTITSISSSCPGMKITISISIFDILPKITELKYSTIYLHLPPYLPRKNQPKVGKQTILGLNGYCKIWNAYVKTCKKWCDKRNRRAGASHMARFYRNLPNQEVDPETIHFPTKVDDVVLFRLGLSSKHLFFLHAAVDLFPPQVQICTCMEHAGTHFVESVCSDLMTASCLVDFNKAWQWKDLRQSWWLLTSLLSSTLLESYNSRSWSLWTLAMNKYSSYFLGRPEDCSWFLMKAPYPSWSSDSQRSDCISYSGAGLWPQTWYAKHLYLPSLWSRWTGHDAEIQEVQLYTNYSLLSLPSGVFVTFLLWEVRMIYKSHGFFKQAVLINLYSKKENTSDIDNTHTHRARLS